MDSLQNSAVIIKDREEERQRIMKEIEISHIKFQENILIERESITAKVISPINNGRISKQNSSKELALKKTINNQEKKKNFISRVQSKENVNINNKYSTQKPNLQTQNKPTDNQLKERAKKVFRIQLVQCDKDNPLKVSETPKMEKAYLNGLKSKYQVKE